MYKEKRILGLIPARGGSKGLPRKNILPFLEKPLIAWSIEVAYASKFLDRTIVSTDDEEIASVARQWGAEVPFLRPSKFAEDTSPTIDAVLYTIDVLRDKGDEYDYIALIEPTSPLRKKDDIDNCIRTLLDVPETDALVTLGEVHLEHPRIMKRISNGLVRSYTDLPIIFQRQEADPAYFPYGVLYLTKVEMLYRYKTFYPEKLIPFYIERWQNYEIDDEVDFKISEFIMKNYNSLSFF